MDGSFLPVLYYGTSTTHPGTSNILLWALAIFERMHYLLVTFCTGVAKQQPSQFAPTAPSPLENKVETSMPAERETLCEPAARVNVIANGHGKQAARAAPAARPLAGSKRTPGKAAAKMVPPASLHDQRARAVFAVMERCVFWRILVLFSRYVVSSERACDARIH